jgi:hypothetical protein
VTQHVTSTATTRLLSLCALALLSAEDARADGIALLPRGWNGPDLTLYAGPSFGGAGAIVPRRDPADCIRCSVAGTGDVMEAREPRLATVALGLAGSEGRLRGGGELFSVLGLAGGDTTGYSGAVTYAGLDLGAAFAQAGLGLGGYWGGERSESGLGLLAGTAHAQIGVRVMRQLVLLGRCDLLVNGDAIAPVGSVGLQWIPGERTHSTRGPASSSFSPE